MNLRRSPLRFLLLAIPFVWQLGLARWANGVTIPGLPMPFPMAWQMAGVVVASLSIGALYRIERNAAGPDEDEPS